ncbi:MAG: NAD(P)-dependent malic enzyme [Thermoplasmatota archaeon]
MRDIVVEKVTKEELLEKSRKPGRDAMKLHPFYRGKIEVVSKCVVRDLDDFGIWYTPGVAEPCRDIAKNPDRVFEHTNKANTVAVVSDGTRVLGLGDIGPRAGLPVMEGKALLFKYLGGVDAVPIMLDTKDPDQLIQAVKWMTPGFGGINLEDISSPKCFYILDRLRREVDIPVWHDDQQGTAAITLAAVINGLKIVGKRMDQALFSIIGVGAANVCLIRTLIKAGVPGRNIIAVDSTGILHPHREDLPALEEENRYKYQIALDTNGEGRTGGMAQAIRDTDVCIAASRPGPGTIKPEWAASMNDDAVMIAEANPIPEIWPWEAEEAGVRIFGTGRSDFPNQVNNSLGFPAIFRGTLDVMATTISDEMHIAAAYAIAEVAEQKGLREDYIVPTMEDWEVFPHEAAAVGRTAIEQGLARRTLSREELYQRAEATIRRAREETQFRMQKGFIPPPPE